MALKLNLCVFILAFSLCRGSIINAPADIDACVGEDVNIPWTYDDNDADISSVTWYASNGNEIMTYFGGGGSHDATNSYTVVNHGNGNITLNNVPISYTDAYKIAVSGASNSEDVVEVTVCAASAGLTSSKSGQIITCEASDLGNPAAALTIWIDGVEQSSSSATVTDLNEVSCCLSGCAVSCMNGGSSSATESCIVVQGTTTTTSTTTTPTTTTTTTSTTTTTTTTPTTTTTTPTTTTTTPTTTTTTPTTTTTTPTTTTTTPTTTTTTPPTTTTTTPTTITTTHTTTTTTDATTKTVVIIVCAVILILVLVGASLILWWILKERKSHSGNLRHNEKRRPTPHKTQSHFYPGVQQPLHNNVSRMNGSQYGHGQEGKLKLNPVYNRATNAPAYHGHHHYYQGRAGRMEQYPPTMAADRYPATVYIGAQPRVTDNNGLYSVPTVHPGYARAHNRSNEWPINGSTFVRNRENYVVGDYSRNWY